MLPDTSLGDDAYFELPCHRGQKDYEIHLLESGDVLVIKDKCMYLCTHRDEMPYVLAFYPTLADKHNV